MEIQKIKRTAPASPSGIKSGGRDSGGKPDRAFQNVFQEERKEQYRIRAAALFDEISAEAPVMLARADIGEFEKYRKLIGELLQAVVNNAYSVHSERILDLTGKNAIYMTIKIIDSKLESLASDLLDRNSNSIDYLCRIDEIRGLVMDVLL